MRAHAPVAHAQTLPSNNSESDATPPSEKDGVVRDATHLEVIRTVSRVPGNSHYYEKDGLRTYGDDEDHDHEPPVSAESRCAIGVGF